MANGIVIRGGNHHIKNDIYIPLSKEKLIDMGFLKEGEEPDASTASKVQSALKINVREVPDDRFGPDYYLDLAIGDVMNEYPIETYWYSTTFGNASKFASWLRNTHLTIRPEDVWENAGRERNAREIKAAASSAWSTSGAKDFKLDMIPNQDIMNIHAKGPAGEDNIGIMWKVYIPEDNDVFTIWQYANWSLSYPDPERKWVVTGIDELEASLKDEFKALQDAFDVSKANEGAVVTAADAKGAIDAAFKAMAPKLFTNDIDDDLKHSGIDIRPRTSDGELCGVSWRILPDAGVVARYADNLKDGTSEVIAELDFNTLEELENILADEFDSLDETLQISLENGGWN